jgi:hypothetical protein
MLQSMNAHIRKTKLLAPVLILLLLLTLTGCAVKLISDYDEIIDHYTVNLQAKIETFMIKMERLAGTPEGKYTNNAAFYDEIQGSLASILLRSQSLDKSEEVSEQIVLVQKNIENLRKLHQIQGEKGLTADVLEPMRVAFTVQFKAMTKLQEALKRDQKIEN